MNTASEVMEAINFGAFYKACLEYGKEIFHYSTYEGVSGIINTNEMWATEYHHLNDSTEFTLIDDIIEEALNTSFGIANYRSKLIEFVKEEIKKQEDECSDPQKSFYVLSFSTNGDNLTLWSEFADNGYNLGWYPDKLRFNIGDIHSMEVVYNHEDQVYTMISAIDSLNFPDFPNEEEIHEMAKCIALLARYYGMGMKWDAFESEKEYRYIVSGVNKDIYFRDKNGMNVPYIKIPFDSSFSKINSITSSYKEREDNLKRMQEVLNNEKCCDIEKRKSTIPLRY